MISGLYTDTFKARKDYICDNCSLPIRKGESYDKEHYYMGATFRYHLYGGLGGSKSGCQEAQKSAHKIIKIC